MAMAIKCTSSPHVIINMGRDKLPFVLFFPREGVIVTKLLHPVATFTPMSHI